MDGHAKNISSQWQIDANMISDSLILEARRKAGSINLEHLKAFFPLTPVPDFMWPRTGDTSVCIDRISGKTWLEAYIDGSYEGCGILLHYMHGTGLAYYIPLFVLVLVPDEKAFPLDQIGQPDRDDRSRVIDALIRHKAELQELLTRDQFYSLMSCVEASLAAEAVYALSDRGSLFDFIGHCRSLIDLWNDDEL